MQHQQRVDGDVPQDKAGAPTPRSPRVEVIHAVVSGRLRVRVPGLRRHPKLAELLEYRLLKLPHVRRVQANTVTGNLLVLFARDITFEAMIADVDASLPETHRPPPPAEPRTPWRLPWVRRRESRAGPGEAARGEGPPWHALGRPRVLEMLQSSSERGLTSDEAAERLARDGPNLLAGTARRSQLAIAMEQFATAPVAMLGASAAISVLTGGLADAVAILAVVMINAGVGFLTERTAEKTISALTKSAPRSACVVRDGTPGDVPVGEVVRGDLLMLEPGAYVAADARLLRSANLSVDESALTGESMPVPKSAGFSGREDTSLADRRNMVYMGTTVTGGDARAVVVGTAGTSELGHIQQLVGEALAPETPMQRQLSSLGTQLAILSGAVCAGVFAVGVLRGYGLLQMLKSSISLAVAAVPEGLPAVATTTLALGIRRMREHQVAIRHLDAVETLGSVQAFCLDKTGTLTRNRMTVVTICADGDDFTVTDAGVFLDQRRVDPCAHGVLAPLMETITLCTENEPAEDGTPGTTGISPTERALQDLAEASGLDLVGLNCERPRLRTEFRSEGRPFMRTWHRIDEGARLLAVKGSPAEVLAMCTHYRTADGRHALDDVQRQRILAGNERMAADALRVLGAASARIDDQGEAALTWLGLVGLTDPLRPGMDELMNTFHGAGIRTVMITGDQSATAHAIGRQLKLSEGRPIEIIDSTALDKLDPQLLAALVKKVHVFARVSPAHKLRIVQAFQRGGQVVAMTGDGMNDGPALKAADIGVAMGGTGSEVARSVSDVVLEDDNLHTMVVAVSQGRTIYGNIRKAVHFLLATNFAEIEVMLAGIALGRSEPLTPIQLLWINLITDIFPGLALSLEPDEPDVIRRPPRDPREPIIRRDQLARMGLESAVITGGALANYGYGLLRYGPSPKASTQVFVSLTLAQLLHSFSCRSEDPVLFTRKHRPANHFLNWGIAGSLALQVLAMAVPGIRKFLGTAPMGPLDVGVALAGAGLPLIINELSKPGRKQPSKQIDATKPAIEQSERSPEQQE